MAWFERLLSRRAQGPVAKEAAGLSKPVLESHGRCPTCDRDVDFVAHDPWLRDHFLCSSCGSIPRERALMVVIETFYPRWRDLVVHESSPTMRGASRRLSQECRGYLATQYLPGEAVGSIVKSVRCENMEALTFDDASVDIHVTQDVMEHVFRPAQAFREIARTLRPGGGHVFTVPIVNRDQPSRVRAIMDEGGSVKHLEPPIFHCNPVSQDGALVTMDWGFDICRHIFEATGLFTHIFRIDDLGKGIRADFIDVLVTVKPQVSVAEPPRPT